MNKIIFILFVFLSSCASLKTFQMPAKINLVEINNMHFVRVTFNEIKTLLLIDTGASKSLLDISKSEEYGFSYTLLSKKQYVGLGGLQDIYVIYDYKIQEIWITFLGVDLSEIQGYFNKSGIDIVGIIGSDFIKNYNVVIDFKNNIMYLNS